MAGPVLTCDAGAIGGAFGAHWVRAGIAVLLVDADRDHVVACGGPGRLVELVHDVEDGRRSQSPETFNAMLRACR